MLIRNHIGIVFILLSISSAESLYDVFMEADSANGYNKYITLNSDVVYTGGLGSSEHSIYIEGNGAVIDLNEGTGIWIAGDETATGSLNINRCTIIYGGYYGINLSGYSDNFITNCNIISSYWGIHVNDSVRVTIQNVNLVGNDYGIAVSGDRTNIFIDYVNSWNNTNNFMINCFG
ncbi:MAG: right-handed parallel beta-helix repeat-containing protein [Candidatus Marinimicrobia bacterium]|nr:right-handed parallel beta-helix repeat-containing protein [Candidatus Neomarinimicrobiota bacterium]